MIGALWERWVALWDERERPISLGLIRIFMGLCLVYDFSHIGVLGLVDALFGTAEVHGLSDALMRDKIPVFYELMPATIASARALWVVLLGASITFTVGWFTRTSALVLVLGWAQFSGILPYADRGIDTLCRVILCIMVFAPAGAWGSLDAWWRTGSVWGDGQPRGGWARRLIILQLVLMYFMAGLLKTGVTWWPWGGSSALYFALQDPAVAAFDTIAWRSTLWFAATQFGATTTLIYQLTYPTVLVLMLWRRHPEYGGAWATFANRWRLEFLWIAVGAFFHVSLAIVMNLGIFPWAMLALYPAWLHPDEWDDVFRGVRSVGWGAREQLLARELP